MNDQELDMRLKALVASAVAVAPPAPELPTGTDAVVRSFERPRRPQGMVWAGIGVAAAAVVAAVMVWSGGDDDSRIVAASTTIVSATTAPAPPSGSWPSDLAVIIASERGVERVSAESGLAVVTRLDTALEGDVAFQIPNGTIVSQQGLIDVSLNGDLLIQEGDTVTAIDASGLEQVLSSFQRLTHGLDIYVGQTDAGNGRWAPVLMIIGDPAVRTDYWADLGVAGPHNTDDSPRLFSVSPSGSTIGWVQGDQFVRADGQSFAIPDGSKVVEVDLTDGFVALTRGDGPGTIIDLSTGAAYEAPAAGRLTVSLAPVQSAPLPTTTAPDTGPAPTPTEVTSNVITAGPDGVWKVADGVSSQLTDQPMSAAIMAPNGWVIMQRQSGWGSWPQGDTAILAWVDGDLLDLFPGEALTGWVRLYDVAVVNGQPTLLYAVEQEAQPQSASDGSVLLARSLDTGDVTVVDDQFGGWEQGHSRMYLAETGLIVGEYSQEVTRQLVSYSIGDVAPLTAAALGLEPSYSDCGDCPRLFTVSRDGSTAAWLDGTSLVRTPLDPASGIDSAIDLGSLAIGATGIELGDGFVVVNNDWGDTATAPTVVEFGTGTLESYQTPGTVASAVVAATIPWATDDALTAALQGQSFGSSDELYAAVEAQIEAIRYAAVDPVEPITFTRFVLPDGSRTIAAPNFDDSVPETWYRIVTSATSPLIIERIESVAVCRDGSYSTPTHLCV